jgi:hypothetical protein
MNSSAGIAAVLATLLLRRGVLAATSELLLLVLQHIWALLLNCVSVVALLAAA